MVPLQAQHLSQCWDCEVPMCRACANATPYSSPRLLPYTWAFRNPNTPPRSALWGVSSQKEHLTESNRHLDQQFDPCGGTSSVVLAPRRILWSHNGACNLCRWRLLELPSRLLARRLQRLARAKWVWGFQVLQELSWDVLSTHCIFYLCCGYLALFNALGDVFNRLVFACRPQPKSGWLGFYRLQANPILCDQIYFFFISQNY